MKKRTKDVLVESMHKFRVGNLNIRVWRQEASVDAIPNNLDLQTVVEEFLNQGAIAVINQLIQCHRVNAVEILNDSGRDGLVVYSDWP